MKTFQDTNQAKKWLSVCYCQQAPSQENIEPNITNHKFASRGLTTFTALQQPLVLEAQIRKTPQEISIIGRNLKNTKRGGIPLPGQMLWTEYQNKGWTLRKMTYRL